jgi:hypothetical protein
MFVLKLGIVECHLKAIMAIVMEGKNLAYCSLEAHA